MKSVLALGMCVGAYAFGNGCPPTPAPKKFTCEEAAMINHPQAPRDLSTTNGKLHDGAVAPTAALLSEKQANKMKQTNVHFHLGAEHKSDHYNDATASEKYDAAEAHHRRQLSESPRPGFMCPNTDLTPEQLDDSYVWQHCTGKMHVGNSYETHYVHSSAGYSDELADGLGAAAGGGLTLNPMLAVETIVYHIVAGEEIGDHDLVHGWDHVEHDDALAYLGSTTGQSHDNEVCSPYVVSWHVNTHCVQVSAATFDNMCRQMKEEYGMEADLASHGSRKLVDKAYVVPMGDVHLLRNV